MQQLKREIVLFGSLLFLSAMVAPTFAVAQQTASTSSDAGDPTVLLIAEHRNSVAASKKDALNSAMRGTLMDVFSNSGKYQVFSYSPDIPVLKKAILEHLIQISDLEEPLKPAALHKIASVLGAKSIITFHSVMEKTGIRTDLSFDETAGQDSWRTKFGNQFRTPLTVGKRKLNLEEMIDVNVDAIAKSIGVPCHLLEDLHLEVALPPVAVQPDKKSTGKAAPATSVTSQGTQPPPDNPTVGSQTPPVTQAQSTDPPVPAITTPSRGSGTKQGKVKGQKDPVISTLPSPGQTNSISDGAQSSSSDPTQPFVEENISNIARAQRYRQSGDLPSTILYLRRAVNDNPSDVEVRRQLIQAYQDDNQPSLAQAELSRTLKLDNKNSSLYRLMGDALYADGHIPEAIRAYQQSIELNPSDVQTHISLGDLEISNGDFDAALKSYMEAAASAPGNPLPHRRLARAACQKASSNSAQYAVAISEVKKARGLTAPTETKSYLADYVSMMKIMESRLMDILEQVDSTYGAYLKGQNDRASSGRIIADMLERATAASDFLDGLPAAAGQEGCQALYQEGAASVISSITYLKSYVATGDTQYEQKLKNERTSARHDLADAGKRLIAAKAAAEAK